MGGSGVIDQFLNVLGDPINYRTFREITYTEENAKLPGLVGKVLPNSLTGDR
jgi:hypothetical protein